MSFLSINVSQILFHLIQLLIAYLLALPLGLNRERQTRSLGLRTYPLVSIGSCGFMLTGISVLDGSEAQARVMYGLITGMGFIGGGAIVKDTRTVRGTATAASLWITGAIGIAVAWQVYEIAILLSIATFLVFWLNPDKDKQ